MLSSDGDEKYKINTCGYFKDCTKKKSITKKMKY